MEQKDFHKLTDEELLVEKARLKKSKLFHAGYIGFLAGILIFGVVAWGLSSKRHFGFLIPMAIPVIFIYKAIKSPNKHEGLEKVLQERNLD